MAKAIKEIGKLILKKRKEKDISQAQLSLMVYGNEHYATQISNIERNQLKGVKFMTILNLLAVLEINLILQGRQVEEADAIIVNNELIK
jgi:transcriptional regulator with XRE-family HTH domain